MDWTSVYSESGDEELMYHAMEEISHSRPLSRMVSFSRISTNRRYPLKSKLFSKDIGGDKIQREKWKEPASVFDEEEEVEDIDDYSSHRLFQQLSADDVDDHDGDYHDEPSYQSNYQDKSSSEDSNYTLFAVYCLAINYILGVGCLGVPYAFAKAGFLLCICIFTTVTITSYITVMWIAETGQRLEQQQIYHHFQKESKPNRTNASSTIYTEQSPLIHEHHHQQLDDKILGVDIRQYEVLDLIGYYLGSFHKALYQISLMALMYIGLLAYSQVFCAAIAAVLPIANSGTTNWIPQALFGIFVIPLSIMDLEDQISVQAVMALVRFLAIFIMIAGSFIALYNDDTYTTKSMPPYFAPTVDNEMSYTFCFSGFSVAFSTALFSQLFQHSVPGLIRPFQTSNNNNNNNTKQQQDTNNKMNNGKSRKNELQQIPFVFGASLITTYTLYLLLGIVSASYFGSNTKSSINLNFVSDNFSFGIDKTSVDPSSWLAIASKIASQIVVMFPALDTLSVFPLIANTLGNNLFSSSPFLVKWVARVTFNRSKKKNEHVKYYLTKDEKMRQLKLASKIANVFWKLVASIPPLIGSIWATDLSFSFSLAGVAGVYVAFFAPSLLQYYSIQKDYQQSRKRNDNELSSARILDGGIYLHEEISTGWYSSTYLVYPVFTFAAFALGLVAFQIKDAWHSASQ